jgi:DtxR family Mn-dependent transcriptional regulator
VISEDFEDRLAARLGHPKTDPHGDPIPAKDGRLPADRPICLTNLDVGHGARVTRVQDGDPSLLRYAAQLGLRPEARVTLLSADPYGGSLRVLIDGVEQAIGPGLASQVFVTPERPARFPDRRSARRERARE